MLCHANLSHPSSVLLCCGLFLGWTFEAPKRYQVARNRIKINVHKQLYVYINTINTIKFKAMNWCRIRPPSTLGLRDFTRPTIYLHLCQHCQSVRSQPFFKFSSLGIGSSTSEITGKGCRTVQFKWFSNLGLQRVIGIDKVRDRH